MLSATVSFLAGNLPWNYFAARAPMTAQIGAFGVFVLSAAMFLLAGNLIKDLRWLQALVWTFLAIGAVVVLGRLLPPLGAVAARLVQAGAVGSLFWVWMVALAGGQALFNRELRPLYRTILFGLAMVVLAAAFFPGRSWASGWLPAFVALGVLIWLRSWRLGLALTLVAVVAVQLYAPALPAALIRGDQYSIFTRQAAWELLLAQVVKASPVIGLGPANYYHYTPLFPLLGWYVKFNSHNQYVDIIAQVGLVGAVAFAWLMATIAAARIQSQARRHPMDSRRPTPAPAWQAWRAAWRPAGWPTGSCRLSTTLGWQACAPACWGGCSWAAWSPSCASRNHAPATVGDRWISPSSSSVGTRVTCWRSAWSRSLPICRMRRSMSGWSTTPRPTAAPAWCASALRR